MSMIKQTEKLTLFDNNKVNYERMNNDDENLKNKHGAN